MTLSCQVTMEKKMKVNKTTVLTMIASILALPVPVPLNLGLVHLRATMSLHPPPLLYKMKVG